MFISQKNLYEMSMEDKAKLLKIIDPYILARFYADYEYCEKILPLLKRMVKEKKYEKSDLLKILQLETQIYTQLFSEIKKVFSQLIKQKEREYREWLAEPIERALRIKQILEKYRVSQIVHRPDGIYRIDGEGKEWHVGIPYGVRKVSSELKFAGIGEGVEVDRERLNQKLALWNSLFSEKELKRWLEKIMQGPFEEIDKVYNRQEIEEKLKIYKEG
ncbi:MAG TPA: hypothetical protein ENG13_03390 [bacterium]|nr:hypothetical protein [bacterium]HEX68092.1 hypothetical protein [bacterium]